MYSFESIVSVLTMFRTWRFHSGQLPFSALRLGGCRSWCILSHFFFFSIGFNHQFYLVNLSQLLKFYQLYKCVGLLLLQPIRSPLAPNVLITGIVPSESSIFKSALHPLRLTFRTANGGSWKIIFKKGDDLRQDQLVAINIFPLFVTHTHIT